MSFSYFSEDTMKFDNLINIRMFDILDIPEIKYKLYTLWLLSNELQLKYDSIILHYFNMISSYTKLIEKSTTEFEFYINVNTGIKKICVIVIWLEAYINLQKKLRI